jgi:sulfate/thiosulfate transport system permease protein
MAGRLTLRAVMLAYLSVILLLPVGIVLYKTLQPGLGSVWDSITTPAAIHAFWLTVTVTLIAVPLNAAFGVLAALVLVRGKIRGRRALEAFIDLPFAVSPVVVGLSLILLYGRTGWFGGELQTLGFKVIFSMPGIVLATLFVCLPFVAREVEPVLREIGDDQEQAASTLGANGWLGGALASAGIQVIFSTPGIVLATIFVTLPFVVREVAPVLREVGDEQEQAAATLGASRTQTFRRITLPAIRWGIAYGVVLSTARAIGEFGAVSVVSGKISGQTETLTLLVEKRFENFDLAGAYAASALLAVIALTTLLALTVIKPRKEHA